MSNIDTNTEILGLLLMGDGLHPNDWGDETNTNLQTIENAAKGIISIAITGNISLTQAQAAFANIVFTGSLTGAATVTMPATPNLWSIQNNSGQVITLTTGTGTTVAVANGINLIYACDGTNIYDNSPQTDIVPIGASIEYPSLTPPNANYMLENGVALSRTTFATLYALIGTTFGAGDGVTTFNIPDSQGRIGVSADNGTGRFGGRSIGAVGGATNWSVSLTAANNGPHAHGVNDPSHAHGVSDPTHNHSQEGNGTVGAQNNTNIFPLNGGSRATSNSGTGIGIFGAVTGISIQSNGSGTAFSTVGPYIVKAKHMRVM